MKLQNTMSELRVTLIKLSLRNLVKFRFFLFDMIDMMLLIFHPVAVVGKTVHKQKINNYMQGEKQYTKQYKNTTHKQKEKHTEQENKHKTNN